MQVCDVAPSDGVMSHSGEAPSVSAALALSLAAVVLRHKAKV